MGEKVVVIGVIVVLLVVVSIATGALWLGVLTGKVIEAQEDTAFDAEKYDARGFVGLCGEEDCVTLPTLIEQDGEEWQLGFYAEQSGANGEPQLAYRNARGKFMTVVEAFARE